MVLVLQRAELPDCTKVYSIGLRDKFETASVKRDYHIEEEVHDYLANFIHENERKIEPAKARLQQTQEGPEDEDKVGYSICSFLSCECTFLMFDQLDKIHELAVQIGEQVAKAEDLGKCKI